MHTGLNLFLSRVTHTLTSVATPSVTSSSTASPSGLLRRPLVSNGASPPPTSSTTAAAAGLTRPPLHTEGEGQPPSQRFSGAVMLTKLDYYTVPPCDELDEMIQDGCCEVEGFTIGRRGYGEIHFPDKTDVYGMNLDQLGEEKQYNFVSVNDFLILPHSSFN